MTRIFIDADACPVRDEVYRVAERLDLDVILVSNGSRPIRPTGNPRHRMVVVGGGSDVADDWIAEAIEPRDLCVTADIPLAARCLDKGALAVSPHGRRWTEANIGSALAGREISMHLREIGAPTRGSAPFSKADRSRFLGALDTALREAMRA
jgi:uncharacterized protein YaiI (UPF0178 family)